MARNFVPRVDGEGSLGRADKKWGGLYVEDAVLSGNSTATTQAANDDSDNIATTAHVLDRLQLYGVGVTSGVSVTNFDATDIPSGMYQVQNASGTNPGNTYGFLLVERYGANSIKQTYTHISTATTLTMAYRTYNASTSTWNPWRQIFHQGNILGTVSQSDGIPTGAVIERGSNANGEYVKFADGTLICTGSTPTTIQVTDAGSGTYRYRYDQRSSDFAAIFASVPKVAVIFRKGGVAGIEGGVNTTTTSNTGRIRGVSESVNMTDAYYEFIAIGRWY